MQADDIILTVNIPVIMMHQNILNILDTLRPVISSISSANLSAPEALCYK
jgi:hypothetical protein